MVTSKRPNQVSVSLSPPVRAEIARLVSAGVVYSEQEFIRVAVSEKITKLRREEQGIPDSLFPEGHPADKARARLKAQKRSQ